ncbi:MAG: DNA-processing protein DprA [Gemmatales bacterium]|nr:DNA-processing protein DprA [Gemmatales bacterium]MDW7994800.1 DNA-processing protein DprA [Gemmatales bacterium]
MDAETRALLTLRLVPGLGPRLIRALVNHFGTAQAVIAADAEQLASVPRLPHKLAQALRHAIAQAPVERELAEAAAAQTRLISWNSPDYPVWLRNLSDAPPLLYVRGELVPNEPCVAFVGSRHCTYYGRRITESLVTGLVRAGYTIVSGLARGIDAIAHQTALSQGGRTIAISAGGLLCVYPPEHRDLAQRIVRQGALVSEQPMRMPPERQLFPARNRLISGWCQGVVVVEASERSGALITARHAVEQGREVFVVPGPVDSPNSGGIVQLLRQGAYPIRDASEIIAVLRNLQANDKAHSATGQLSPRSPALFPDTSARDAALQRVRPTIAMTTPADPPQKAQTSEYSTSSLATGEPTSAPLEKMNSWPVGLPECARQLYEVLTEVPQDVDALVERTGLSAQDLARAAVQLELHGLIRRLPGNRLARCR